MNVETPILVFGGPYSNLQATEAVLAEASRRNIPGHRVICTGDVVAYGADPKACVDLVRRAGIRVVMGNCEEQLAADAVDCGCGFAPGSECDRLSAAWFAHARLALDRADREWMGTLPRTTRHNRFRTTPGCCSRQPLSHKPLRLCIDAFPR